MIKTDNLYAEVVINESPFYYDDHGRLRARVLNEEQSLNELSMRESENAQMTYFSPNSPEVKKAAEKKPGGQTPPPGMELNPDYKDRFSGGQIGTMDMRPSDEKFRLKKPMAPVEKTDMPAKQKPGQGRGVIRLPSQGFNPGQGRGVARPLPAVPPSGKEPKRPGKPLRSFRFSSQSRPGAGRNVNTRAGLRSVLPSRPSNMTLAERLDLKKADMGTVIKDFQKSDAPQFKGKSKTKRREMAIAAKLQAERGTK